MKSIQGDFLKKGMTLTEWLDVCKKSGLSEPKKIAVKEGDIYLSEGYYKARVEHEHPHMMTVWAIGRDESMIVARQHYHNLEADMMSKDERLAEAERDAREFLGEPRN